MSHMPGYISEDSEEELCHKNIRTLKALEFKPRTRPGPNQTITSKRSGNDVGTRADKENKLKVVHIRPQEGIIEDVDDSTLVDECIKKAFNTQSNKAGALSSTDFAKKVKDEPAKVPTEDENIIQEVKQSSKRREDVLRDDEKDASRITKKEQEIVQETTQYSVEYFNVILDNLKQFVHLLPPKDINVKCRITRDTKGIDKGLHPTYYMHYEREDGRKVFLLAARKSNFGIKSKYLISIDPIELTKKGCNYVGAMTEQKTGSNYCLYNDGESLKKVGMDSKLRCELVSVIYENNLLGIQGPRKITVILPGFEEDNDYKQMRITEDASLLERYKKGRLKSILCLNNKEPTWNEKTNHFALNFHGRVTTSSVKNFQIINLKNPDQILLQFGKVHDDTFTCDYSYPFSAIQAFAIALSSFDT